MKFKALKNFCGAISMYAGEVRELTEGEATKDLLSAGYIEAAETVKKANKAPAKKEAAKNEDIGADGGNSKTVRKSTNK